MVPAEPLALLLRPGAPAAAAAVAAGAARALLDLGDGAAAAWPAWLFPHQVPAAERLAAIVGRYGGALLADAVGLGKSYVALAVAQRMGGPLTLVVPAVLVPQWRALLARLELRALIVTHEILSQRGQRPARPPTSPPAFVIIDEAHRFRNADTRRYRALAKLVLGSRVLAVTATPVHNRVADLFHLFRLFARDHALAGLGVPSLARAARGEIAPETLGAVAARLTVARSRTRVRAAYPPEAFRAAFPNRAATLGVRAGTASPTVVAELVSGIRRLGAGQEATALFRLALLRRLASSLPALRATLDRYETLLDVAQLAAAQGRALPRRDFERLFPRREEGEVQLVLFPLLLQPGGTAVPPEDRALLSRLRALARCGDDPKALALLRLLGSRGGKTIVFTDAVATARHLARLIRRRCRVAAIVGSGATMGVERVGRAEALAAFAPLAQGAPPPAAAHEADVLIATDLLSEGLNLQDAARVVHYDLPWSPARLAQRVGRIDRLGSPHACIETVTFLPPAPLDRALDIEERVAAKARVQAAAGTAERETTDGAERGPGPLDWCDRLQALAARAAAPAGGTAVVRAGESAAVLVVRLGALVEAFVVKEESVRADPVEAARLLELAARAETPPAESDALDRAIREAAPLVRARLAAVSDARWRAADRDRLSRRLIPWVLTAARRAARAGNAGKLAALDALVSRLALGMTAGEELGLAELLERPAPLSIDDLRRWHERLPPVNEPEDAPRAELVAAVVLASECSRVTGSH